MNPIDILYKIVPESTFRNLRNLYYVGIKAAYPPLSKDRFVHLLTDRLGVRKGMVVYVHSSLDKLNLKFSAYQLLETMQEIVGHKGTLLFPCWQYVGRAEDYINSDGYRNFNVRTSTTTMGLLPELVRRHKDSYRSLHPTSSVVAIGHDAEEMIKEHHKDIYPNGEFSPLYKLNQYDSRIIGLGEKVVSLSYVHVVEDIMKEDFPIQTLGNAPVTLNSVDSTGRNHEIQTLLPHSNIGARNTPEYCKKHISQDICRTISYCGSNYFSAVPITLLAEMKKLAMDGKTIYSI